MRDWILDEIQKLFLWKRKEPLVHCGALWENGHPEIFFRTFISSKFYQRSHMPCLQHAQQWDNIGNFWKRQTDSLAVWLPMITCHNTLNYSELYTGNQSQDYVLKDSVIVLTERPRQDQQLRNRVEHIYNQHPWHLSLNLSIFHPMNYRPPRRMTFNEYSARICSFGMELTSSRNCYFGTTRSKFIQARNTSTQYFSRLRLRQNRTNQIHLTPPTLRSYYGLI